MIWQLLLQVLNFDQSIGKWLQSYESRFEGFEIEMNSRMITWYSRFLSQFLKKTCSARFPIAFLSRILHIRTLCIRTSYPPCIRILWMRMLPVPLDLHYVVYRVTEADVVKLIVAVVVPVLPRRWRSALDVFN